jgi:hypothetical protein
MAGELRTCVTYLLDTLLPTIDGGTITQTDGDAYSCTFDLTGAGRIVFGTPPKGGPELVDGGQPVVYVWTGSPTAEFTDDPISGATMFGFGLVLRLNIRGYVTPQDAANEGDTGRGRILRAMDLTNDLMAAIMADREMGGNALRVLARFDSFSGEEIHADNYGIAAAELTIHTARS